MGSGASVYMWMVNGSEARGRRTALLIAFVGKNCHYGHHGFLTYFCKLELRCNFIMAILKTRMDCISFAQKRLEDAKNLQNLIHEKEVERKQKEAEALQKKLVCHAT